MVQDSLNMGLALASDLAENCRVAMFAIASCELDTCSALC